MTPRSLGVDRGLRPEPIQATRRAAITWWGLVGDSWPAPFHLAMGRDRIDECEDGLANMLREAWPAFNDILKRRRKLSSVRMCQKAKIAVHRRRLRRIY